MATVIIETDDGHRVKVMRITSRGQYLAREDFIRMAVIEALKYDALVTGLPAQ